MAQPRRRKPVRAAAKKYRNQPRKRAIGAGGNVPFAAAVGGTSRAELTTSSVPPGLRFHCKDCGVQVETEDDQFHGAHDLVDLWSKESTGNPGVMSVSASDAADENIAVHPTGLGFFDRILGGGLAQDGVYLLSGDPGAGKSTLLSIVASMLAERGVSVLYVTGEETTGQVGRRTRRVGNTPAGLRILATNFLSEIIAEVDALTGTSEDPDVIIIDSIQAIGIDDVDVAGNGMAGSVSTVRELGHRLVGLAKGNRRSILAIVQINKDGTVAGPQALVHAGDVCIHLRKFGEDRILEPTKNRFHDTLERVAIEMYAGGLREVQDPAARILAELIGEIGVVAFPSLEAGRVRVLPIEASVSEAAGTGEDVAPTIGVGIPTSRVKFIIDLLKSHVDIVVDRRTVRVSVPRLTGGSLEDDDGIDLAIAAAILSAYYRASPPDDAVVFGKVGLSGRVQSSARAETRIEAAVKSQCKTVLAPRNTIRNIAIGVRTIGHLRELPLWFGRPAGAIPKGTKESSA